MRPESSKGCMCAWSVIRLLLSTATVMSSAHLSPVTSFLRRTNALLSESTGRKCNVVMGNQACDADSMVSSLCFAYMQSRYSPVCKDVDYVPLALIPRSDMIFRSEVKLLLQKVHVDINDLMCTEDVLLLSMHEKGILQLSLVDHNLLDPRFEKLSSCVAEILDHHTENNQYPWVTGAKRNIAFDSATGKALVGSTCTLVAERFADVLHLEPDVATILQGVIALDTINMDAHAGIGTTRDGEALRRLREISSFEQSELFETLRGAKLDPSFWRDLTVAEVMRIDYKSFHSAAMKEQRIPEIGIATALQTVRDFLSKEALAVTLRETIQAQKLSLLAVMTFVHQPEPRRELMICTQDRHLYDHLLRFLLDGTKHDLHCELLPAEHETAQKLCGVTGADSAPPLYTAVLLQNNAKASRKQVAPLLLNFFETYLSNA